jgi:UDPglucose--hexose-1-phosphate uridylyltransferase
LVWEERFHPLREEWVIVAAHRQDRPWIGETVDRPRRDVPSYLPDCYLCPGNARVGGSRNERYERTYVFDNDLPCVGEGAPRAIGPAGGPYRNRPAAGVARVVCYSPRHDLSLGSLDVGQVDGLLAVWQEQYRDLGDRPEVSHVLVFENRGEAVGVSNPHPHGQIYATNFVFKTIENEARIGERHLAESGRVLFREILAAEETDGRRLLFRSGTAIAFVPYFARYAYEVYVAPLATHASLADLSTAERVDLATVLKDVLLRFDNLWGIPFPYVMALHQAPTDGGSYPGFHFHIELHPPLRKPGLLKYLAGPEIGGGSFLSDTSPEDKAAELRAVPGLLTGTVASRP